MRASKLVASGTGMAAFQPKLPLAGRLLRPIPATTISSPAFEPIRKYIAGVLELLPWMRAFASDLNATAPE